MTKFQIRQNMRSLNKSISQSERCASAHKIFSQIEDLDQFTSARTVAIYVALSDEIPTLEWIERWHNRGLRVVIPRITGKDIEFVEYHPGALSEGGFGILEPTTNEVILPSEIDLMVLPGVAFCADGRRLGRGKGFYDRYLSSGGFRAYTVGVGFAHQLTYDIPCEAHDKLLDHIITTRKESYLPTLISELVEAAGHAADQLRCGIDTLFPKGLSWVLVRLRIEMSRTPNADEPLNIDTWVSECGRLVSTRNFLIYDAHDNLIGKAISQWCMINLKSRRPIDLTHEEINHARFITSRPTIFEPLKKLPTISADEAVKSYQYTANEHDIDFNHHVNTLRYIEMMLAMIPHSQIDQRGETTVDIQFIKESLLGETLTIKQSEGDLFEIVRADGSVSVRALF